jgi:polyphosphate kinase
MMARNLDNRVEMVAPVDDPLATAEIQMVLDLQLADTALSWELGSDGSWSRVRPPEGAKPLNSQEALMEFVSRQARVPGA